jgi:hypothetical protein
MLVYTKARVVAPSFLFTVGTVPGVIVTLLAFLRLTSFLSLNKGLEHGLHEGHVETLADPYKDRIPLPSVPNYQDPDLSRHLIQTGTNAPNGQESFHKGKGMKLSFPTIVME